MIAPMMRIYDIIIDIIDIIDIIIEYCNLIYLFLFCFIFKLTVTI